MVLLGPPGSGKGTQGRLLSQRYKIPLISTGEILREAIKLKLELGSEAEKFLDKGKLVPDDVMLGIVRERISRNDAKGGFILDGFPRTEPQALEFEKLLGEMGTRLDAVVNVDVPEAVIVKRLVSRVVCSKCAANYNLATNPTRVPGRCDACGGKLEKRADDAEETVRTRIAVYHSSTEPLLAFYRERSLLHSISGDGEVSSVFGRVVKSLNSSAG
ncbi:MAG: adenylate kinase [Candidatus Eisenbacteria bacterium]|nr:adenylate kinase [Candidatus Eisenbacteria bacterium]